MPRPFRAAQLTATLRRIRSEDAGPEGARDWVRAGRAFKRLVARRLGEHAEPVKGGAPPLLRATPLEPQLQYREALENARLNTLTRRLYEDFHTRALPTILRDFDRFSMAHGVEVRSPFLDWRVVCFCLSLPARSVLGGGFTKRILREATKGILPEAVRTRTKKIPYKTPLEEWWTGPLNEMVRDTVSSQGFQSSDVWDGKAVSRLLQDASPGRRFNGALMVFRFVAAHRLMELFKGVRTASSAVAHRR